MKRDRNHRDALTGQYTTAADAAARPGETVAEARPERVAVPDTAEIRASLHRLADLAARDGITAMVDLIASLEPLLDTLDTLADRLAHATEARDNARAEVERLTAAVADLRERLARAARMLDFDKLAERGEPRARLHGKAQGVRLAIDYLRGTALDGPQS